MPVRASTRASRSVPTSSPSVSASASAQKWSDLQDDDFVNVPDPDFYDFDSTRTEKDIKSGQAWAIYDDKDGMPRYYARIGSVDLAPFKVNFCWLVPHQPSAGSTLWTTSTGFCLACGDFKDGTHEGSSIINMFSHRIQFKTESVRGAPTLLKIYPRKGDVWAMYRDWDQVQVTARTQTPSDVKCKYDMLEILNDYSKEKGVKTAKLARVPGFRTVFQRQDGPRADHMWSSADMVRFSHFVPAKKMREDKSVGIPKRSLELDPAAAFLEDTENVEGSGDMEKSQLVDGSGDVEMGSPHGKENSARPVHSPQGATKMDVDDGGVGCFGDGPALDAEEVEQRPQQQGSSSPTTAAVAASNSQSSSQLEEPGLEEPGNVEIVPHCDFYDFSSLRTKEDIEAGHIWAIYDAVDRMPRSYVRVTRVFPSPFKVELVRLEPQLCSAPVKSWTERTGRFLSCGDFKNDKPDVLGIKHFSHVVLDRANACVKIYPKKGEVWATYRTQEDRKIGKAKKRHNEDLDLVEILSDFCEEKDLKMVKLAKVSGFRSLFQPRGKPLITKIAQPESLFTFSHSIPARKMYKDDTLRIPLGALELDPAAIPRK